MKINMDSNRCCVGTNGCQLNVVWQRAVVDL